mgnify:CR=1 FL=1
MSQKVKVWDFAVRFFHWSQLVLLIGLWYTGEEGLMALHQILAYSLLALIAARVYWGLFGNKYARFSTFSATPTTAFRYLRKPGAVNGHNPASFYMIVLLIILVLLQLLSGLATSDNSYISDGPLVTSLPAGWVDIASEIHKININILLAAIAVHIVAALWHSFSVHNVLAVMITGTDKQSAVPQQSLRHSVWFFILFAGLLALLYFWQGHKLVALL